MRCRLAAVIAFLCLPNLLLAQELFALKDGDRVVFLGNGVIEQEHAFGHLETRLTRRWPKANVIFRNMGWGGDTVQGLARTSGFQQPDGMGRLLNEIKQVKPTVIFVGYGLNESFAGEKGLESFIRDYRKLLEQLDPLKARLVLLSPTWHEWLGRPFPNPAANNSDLEKYTEAVYQIAAERKAHYVDLFHGLRDAKDERVVLTTNGIQLNSYGYRVLADLVEKQLGFAPAPWEISLGQQGAELAKGIEVKGMKAIPGGYGLVYQDEVVRVPGEVLRLKAVGLKQNVYVVRIDGKMVNAAAKDQLEEGIRVAQPDPGERLRMAIVKKGELFYRRWRPFNDHSRHWGFIGGDFKLYDDEIAALEKEIAELRVPRERTLVIEPAKGGER